MKKRKRKMEEKRVEVKCSQVALLISSSFVIILIINSILLTIIANTVVVHCEPVAAAAAAAAHFDEEHHRLNLSQSTSAGGAGSNDSALNRKFIIIQTESVTTNSSGLFVNANRGQQVKRANFSHSPQLISQQQQQQQQNTNSGSEILNDNSIIDNNDLLAVESGHHLLSVATGSQTKQLTTQSPIREQQTNPPYAINISSTSHYARPLNNSFEATRTTLQPSNETPPNYLSKLYRATNLPSFLQDQQHQQQSTTNKDSPSFHQPTTKHSHQFNLHNYTTTSDLKYPSQQEASDYNYNYNKQATSINVSLPITSSWRSLYYSPSVLATKQTGRPAIGSSSSVQTITKAAAATTTKSTRTDEEEGNYTTQKSDNNMSPRIISHQLEHESEPSKTAPSSAPQQIATQQQTTSTNITNLLGSLNSNGELEGEEEKFERTLAVGNYQRTKNAKNMSWGQLLRQATENNVMESLMVTNKSIVSLSCDTNDMLIRFKFEQPFKGSVVTNLDKSKSCRLLGTGGYYYEMRISLNECGTRQEMPRLFINNIQIEFHDQSSSLYHNNNFDFVENEIKTIICSYPIKPVAPVPPDLPVGLSERIIEQAAAPNEPAKLVYYEPFVLISGLLFLSLTLLGLTMSAYMLAKRFKSSRSTNLTRRNNTLSNNHDGSKDGDGFISSSRIYRNSPAQIANVSFLTPPLIGSEDDINKTKLDKIKAQKRKKIQNYKTIPDKRGRRIRDNIKRYSGSRNSFSTSNRATTETTTKSLKYNDKNKQQNNSSTINLNPNDSPDSLADKNDRSSITTIEIPLSTKIRLSEPSYNFGSPNRINSSKEIEEEGNLKREKMLNRDGKPTSPPPLPPPESNKFVETRRKFEFEEEFKEERKLENQENKKEDRNDHQERQMRLKSNKKSSQYYKSTERLTRRKHPRVQSKEVQAGGDTPPFGSFRSKLTSPREFKRLQEITRMFEEVIIEKVISNSNDRRGDDNDGAGGRKIVHKIDIKPSKYKSKILDQVEESERHLLANMLTKDELFRSLIVDSTNKVIFDRKLKGSPTYGQKFSDPTWKLLEEILLDQDINSFSSSLSPSGIDSNKVINHIDSSSYSAADDEDGTNMAENSNRPRIIKVTTMNEHHNQQQKQHVVAIGNHSIQKNEYDRGRNLDNQVKLSNNNKDDVDVNSSVSSSNDSSESVLVEINAAVAQQSDSQQMERNDSLNSDLQDDSNDDEVVKLNHTLKSNNNSPESSPELMANRELQSTTTTPITNNKVHHKDTVRVSQFNSTLKEGGMTGTLINIDSVTNFTSSKDFSTFTKSRIEHTRYDVQDDSLPLFGHIEKVNSYEYANETIKSSSPSPKFSNNTFSRRMLKKSPAAKGKFSDK